MEKCKNSINHLREHYVDYARDLGKDNTVIIV